MKAACLLAAVVLLAAGSGLRAEEPFYFQPKPIDGFLSARATDPFAAAAPPIGELSKALAPPAGDYAIGQFADPSWPGLVAPSEPSVVLFAEPAISPLQQATANFDWLRQPIDWSLTSSESFQRTSLMGGLAR